MAGGELLSRAWQLAQERKHRESRELVDRAEPETAEELVLAARVLVELRDPEAALPLAKRAVALAPEGWEGHLAVADAQCQLRRWDESIAAARTAVALAPEEAASRRVLAVALSKVEGASTGVRQEMKRAKALGGPKAMQQPGMPSRWALLWGLPVPVFGLLRFGHWSPAVEMALSVLTPVSLVGFLFAVNGPRRAGLTWRQRLAEIRAANAERYGGGGREAAVTAAKAVVPFGFVGAASTGLLSIPGRFGDPLPASVVAPAVLIGGCALAAAMRRMVRWWYGERFLREVFLPDFFVRVHLLVAGALFGGVLLLTLGDGRERQWLVLLGFAGGWLLLAVGTPLAAGVRAGLRAGRDKAAVRAERDRAAVRADRDKPDKAVDLAED